MSGGNNQRDLTFRYVKSGIQNMLKHVLKLDKACKVKNSKCCILEACFCLQLRPVSIAPVCECSAWICGGLARHLLKK